MVWIGHEEEVGEVSYRYVLITLPFEMQWRRGNPRGRADRGLRDCRAGLDPRLRIKQPSLFPSGRLSCLCSLNYSPKQNEPFVFRLVNHWAAGPGWRRGSPAPPDPPPDPGPDVPAGIQLSPYQPQASLGSPTP